MNTPTKLVAFGAVLAVAFGLALLVGTAVGPTDAPIEAEDHGTEHAAERRGTDHAAAAARAADAHGGHDAPPAGLAVADADHALRFDRTRLPSGRRVPLRFRIVDDRGRTVHDAFEVEHEKRLHLVVVRRDTAVFRHVHPRQRRDGTWTVDVDLVDPGVYRAFADFRIGGEQRTLAADLFVPGTFAPRELPAPATTNRSVDPDDAPTTIDVSLDAPPIRAGRETTLRFSATRDGRPVDRLEPYLGAKGHLVALREGDLAYLHVHPTGGAHGQDEHGGGADHHDTGAPEHGHGRAADERSSATFAATFPTAGRYRLFLQVRVDGRVRTVDYTVEVQR